MNRATLSLIPTAESRSDTTMFPIIEAQQASSHSGREFCRVYQLPVHVFYYWLRKYRDQCIEVEGFVRLDMNAELSSWVRMSLGNGRSLEFGEQVSASYLAELILKIG